MNACGSQHNFHAPNPAIVYNSARLRLAGAGESNGRVGAGVAALLVWVRAELRLTEGSVLLAMGEPMGNDSVMSELSCACTIFSQPNNY